jgi:single-strand DNA-binding protein
VWGKQAESCHTYLKKGSSVFIEGRLQYRTWDDEATGTKKSVLEVVADRVQFLDKKKKEEGEGAPRTEEEGVDHEPPAGSGGDTVPF